MEPKKNPKADLSKRSVLFFQLGLILILGLSYMAIEWKTYEKKAIDIGQLQMDDMIEEDVTDVTILNYSWMFKFPSLHKRDCIKKC